VLTAPLPVRSLAISAGAAVIAAAMIVLGNALDLPQFIVIAGVGLMIFAVLLAVVALVLTRRLRTTLILDATSITILNGRRRQVLQWSMIEVVSLNGRRRQVLQWSMIEVVRRQGSRLLLITKPEGDRDVTVFNPRAESDATFATLIAEIQKRLNTDRGYRQIS
jgi:hypothetical protein